MQFEITGALLQNSAGEQKPQLNLNDSWEQVSGVTYEEPRRGQSILKLLTKFGSERSAEVRTRVWARGDLVLIRK